MDRADRAWRVGRVAGILVLAAGTLATGALAVAVSPVAAVVAAVAVPGVAVTAMSAVERIAYRVVGSRWGSTVDATSPLVATRARASSAVTTSGLALATSAQGTGIDTVGAGMARSE